MCTHDVELKHTVPKTNSIGIVVWLINNLNLNSRLKDIEVLKTSKSLISARDQILMTSICISDSH